MTILLAILSVLAAFLSGIVVNDVSNGRFQSFATSSTSSTVQTSLICYEINVMQDGDDYQGYVQLYTIDENGDLDVCYQMQSLKEGVAEYSIYEESEYLIRIYDKDKNVVELETVYTTPIEYSVIEIEIPT